MLSKNALKYYLVFCAIELMLGILLELLQQLQGQGHVASHVEIFSSLGSSMCEAYPWLCAYADLLRQCATSKLQDVQQPRPHVPLPVRHPLHPPYLLPNLHAHLHPAV